MSSDKYMQPIERIPRCSTVSATPHTMQALPVQKQEPKIPTSSTTVVKVLPEDKIRIEIQSNKTSVSCY